MSGRSPVTVDILIDLPAGHRYHQATLAALEHAAAQLEVEAEIQLVGTDDVDAGALGALQGPGRGIIIGPGTPYRVPEAAHAIIATARRRGIPLVAT